MALDFPTSPSVGQLYPDPAVAGVPQYQWDGSVWNAISAPNGEGGAGLPRNRIVNGSMQISQENGDTSGAAASYYPADQWVHGHGGINTTTSGRLQTGGPHTTPIIYSQTSALKSSLAAGDYWYDYQLLEGSRIRDFAWGTAAAKPVVVRFWAMTANAPGTYTFGMGGSVSGRTFLAPFTVTSAWSEIVIAIPGDTLGSYPTADNLATLVFFTYAAGSNYTGVAGWQSAATKLAISGANNGAAVANAIFYIADVGLYLDDGTGTPPPWEMPDPAAELTLCKRYYEKTDPSGGAASLYGGMWPEGGGIPFLVWLFGAEKRAQPTVTLFGTWTQTNFSAPLSFGGISRTAARVYQSPNTGGAWSDFYNNTNSGLVANARM